MNVKEKRELQKLIYDIYYNGEDPIKFKEITGLENYMEELYPSDPSKLVGDWISEHFNVKNFLNIDKLELELKELKELYAKTRFYANLPNGQTTKSIVSEYRRIIKENNPISDRVEDI